MNNSVPSSNKIVVGSFQGFLRIFEPKKGNYKSDHLLIEQNLNDGILQVSLGKFSDDSDLLLAVLHSRSLVIYAVESHGGTTQLASVFKHELSRNSFNFTQGMFGKARNELICIQSVDGQLTIVNKDTLQLEITLPDFYLPGPLIYAKHSDSLIITNTNFEIECYRYSTLNMLVEARDKKPIKPDWS